MFHRRKFLQSSVIGSLALLTGQDAAGATAWAEKRNLLNKPVVISTWDFGRAANAEAWKVLSQRGRALDAVEAGVRVPEADPSIQTVGYGGFPDRDGKVTLDACIMDEKGGCGSVMCLEHIMHPISVARMVMEKTPHIVLAADGALQFALANGFQKVNLLTREAEIAWKEWLKTSRYEPVINFENKTGGPVSAGKLTGSAFSHDTIGMLAMDVNGNLSGACTTSGMAFKMHGRVGDSPIIGAGLFVDNEIGAATSTGVGEEVIRICGSHLVVQFMRQGYSPEKACKAAVDKIVRKDPERAKKIQVGFLALNKKGEFGAYAIHKDFTYNVQNNSTGSSDYRTKSVY